MNNKQNDKKEEDKDASKEIFKEDITTRPTTTSRPPIRITVRQRVADNNEVAMSTATLSRTIDTYFEKPDLMEDLANDLIYAARLMRKLNKRVKNGR